MHTVILYKYISIYIYVHKFICYGQAFYRQAKNTSTHTHTHAYKHTCTYIDVIMRLRANKCTHPVATSDHS